MASRQQRFVEKIYRAARNIGLGEPQSRLAAAQAALETGYGKSVKGNNYFGIKAGSSWGGKTQTFKTWEEEGGRRVNIRDRFRAYDTPEESLRDWQALMERRYPAVMRARTFDEAARGLRYGQRGGYATDSKYGSKLAFIQRKFMGDLPTGPDTERMVAQADGGRIATVAPDQIPLPVPRPGQAYAAEPVGGVLPMQVVERMGQGGSLPVPVPRPLPDAQFNERSSADALPRAPMPSMREPASPRPPIPMASVPVPQTRPRPYQDGTKFHVSKRPDDDERKSAQSVMERLGRQSQELRQQALLATGEEAKRLHEAASTKSAERRTLDEYYNPSMPEMRELANPPRPTPTRPMNEPANPRPPISVASVPTPSDRPQPARQMREPANPSRERLPIPSPRPPVAASNVPVPQDRPQTYAYNPPGPSSSRPMPNVPVPQNRPYPLPAERPRSYATNLPVPSAQRPIPNVPVPTPAPRSSPTPQARPSTYALNPPAPVPNRPPINSGGYAVTPPLDPIATSATALPFVPTDGAADPTALAMEKNRARGVGDATLAPMQASVPSPPMSGGLAMPAPQAPQPRPPMTGPIAVPQPKAPPRAPAPKQSAPPQPSKPTEISWKVPTGMDFWQGKSDYGLDTSGGTLWRDTKTGRQYRYSPQADQVMRVDNGRSIPVFGGSGITGKQARDTAMKAAITMGGAALAGMPGAIAGKMIGDRFVGSNNGNSRNGRGRSGHGNSSTVENIYRQREREAREAALGSTGRTSFSSGSTNPRERSYSEGVSRAIDEGQGGLW